MKQSYFIFLVLCSVISCTPEKTYETIIRNGQIYDGSGENSFQGDIGINGDTIAFIGDLKNAHGNQDFDVKGMAVAPGFINMLSWAVETLIEDGKSQSDIRQGVTLEVFGEGMSWGPLTPETKKNLQESQTDIKYEIEWSTLAEYLDFLVKKGISTNVASFVGATTLRMNAVGLDDREATEDEMIEMKAMTRQAMQEGALGIGSSLIYAPAFYSTTEELIEICKIAAEYDGMYISHMRSEGGRLLESLDELIKISNDAGIRAEIYHLKQSGKANWDKYDQVITKVDSARSAGLHITADMYNYIAGATGLDASMPPWVQAGGYDQWAKRLQDPAIKSKIIKEMSTPSNDWENLMLAAGDPEKILLVGFKNDSLKYLTGKSLGAIAKMRNKSPEETAIDLVIQDGSRVETIYFLMSEDNVRKQIALPWVSFGSDAGSLAPEGVFLKSSTHPRAYGNFSRLLGKYVRDEKIITLEEAIRKLTSLPASNLKIQKRGSLKIGNYADVVIFDPTKIQDNATFDKPQQYATGMIDVFVNGTCVLKNGEHTGASPGMVVKGPGFGKR